MKTDDLIRALVADTATSKPPIGKTVAWALVGGVILAALVFSATMGARSDFLYSIVHSPRFQFKFLFTLAIAFPALFIARRYTRPEGAAGGLIWLLILPAVLLLAGVAGEMMLVPSEHWALFAKGQNSLICMSTIPLLAIAPLAATLYALRQGAPSQPTIAGAAAGLFSAGIAATLYAAHCSDDSPLFVSIWYPAGIAIVTLAGALLGRRLLKW
jgi:hypothetical protein